MSDEIKTVLDIACPGCKARPMVIRGAVPAAPPSLEGFIGRQCEGCGRKMTLADLQGALRAGMDKLIAEREGPQGDAEFP
ncbi:hypothetical protein [Pseudomonas sp. NPDC007930]|uniref:hypothetical protein n=1 Tax=Pseudomonas sp. NPDC007930 TaxID=3364417 RepID=UPI0036F06777